MGVLTLGFSIIIIGTILVFGSIGKEIIASL